MRISFTNLKTSKSCDISVDIALHSALCWVRSPICWAAPCKRRKLPAQVVASKYLFSTQKCGDHATWFCVPALLGRHIRSSKGDFTQLKTPTTIPMESHSKLLCFIQFILSCKKTLPSEQNRTLGNPIIYTSVTKVEKSQHWRKHWMVLIFKFFTVRLLKNRRCPRENCKEKTATQRLARVFRSSAQSGWRK